MHPGSLNTSYSAGSFAIAIDIGTTTLALSLTDPENGRVIDTHTAVNRQRRFGADVITRIEAACVGKASLLRESICRDLADGISVLLTQHRVDPERLTCAAAAGNTTRQIKFIRDFGTTVLHAIPSYASRIYEVMREEGVDPRRDTQLRVLCIGAEPHSEEQRKRIEENLGVKAYNSYGISEMMGPGVAFECPEQNGLHIWEDYFIVEVLDPNTLEPVKEGELGELVLTTINREAMPLLRYRTRDLTRLLSGSCPCGRTHRRISRLQGRSDDMIILKGVNIFPIQIEKILLKFKELSTDYLITLKTENGNDTMTIEVELRELFTDDYQRLQSLTREITRQLKDEILITPKVRLLSKGSIKTSDEKKAVRVQDFRKLF